MTPAAINRFLLDYNLRLATNPCVSPDFCLDWPALSARLTAGAAMTVWEKSRFETAGGSWRLVEDPATGDCAWRHRPRAGRPGGTVLADGLRLPGDIWLFPATWTNLLKLKNLVQSHDAASTIFPTAHPRLGQSTLGVGARFTTLHWPAVEWAMSALGLGVTANQNSIPRELVYDTDAMLAGRLDTVPFPFIGADVPEGHQGQSVEGMSHGCVLSKLKTGFHRRGLPWSFNADHQPIGGKFDAREDALAAGCVLASYITFDLSPELAQTKAPDDAAAWVKANVPAEIISRVRTRVAQTGVTLDEGALAKLLAYVWPAMEKMKRRDDKYQAVRAKYFNTPAGQEYLRELSIDELPGLTTPETTAVMLALCEALKLRIHFVAPAFGFQKNMPFPDNTALRGLIEKQWAVCRQFGASIGFHSGSGKSAENYRVMGEVTGGRLEIKTSGRYTYEMGRALAASRNAADQALWRDWHRFTVELALAGAFSANETERKMARSFIVDALTKADVSRSPAQESRDHPAPQGTGHGASGAASSPASPEAGYAEIFASPAAARAAAEALPASPDNMFWFEYNFLFVLAAGGRAEKAALGDHTAAGYTQRARFYAISAEARLNYLKNVAAYLVFLAEHTGLVPKERCGAAAHLLAGYTTLDAMLGDISR